MSEELCSSSSRHSSTAATTVDSSDVQLLSVSPRNLPKKQPLIDQYTLTSTQKEKIDKALAYFIAVDMQPYNTVAFDQGNPTKLQTSITESNAEVKIPQLYEAIVKEVKLQLKGATFLSFTTDAWTSVSNKPYVSLRAHFVNNDWNMQTVNLTAEK